MPTPAAVQEFTFTIAASHPALPGHFPGNPLVPGVVVLDEVIRGSERVFGCVLAIRGVPTVKFISMLRREQKAHVRVEFAGEQLRFAVRADEAVVAQGSFITTSLQAS